MDEWSARSAFQALGVRVAPAQLVTEDMPSSGVGFPMAVKVVPPDIGHKTEAGGVALGIADDVELPRVKIILDKSSLERRHHSDGDRRS